MWTSTRHGTAFITCSRERHGKAASLSTFSYPGVAQVGDIDVGYGPARVLSAAETRAAHEALTQISDDDLRGRFDPGDMTSKEIYPEIWDRPPEEDDTLSYLLGHVSTLREFLAQAVEHRQGLVVHIT